MKKGYYIEALMHLGLTFLQATVYVTLLKFGKTEAKAISDSSGVARADVYRVMSTLEHLGLVEKIISTPSTYKATPIKEGCVLLLQNRRQRIFINEKHGS